MAEVFDWDGWLVRVAVLDHQGFFPTPDPRDSLLYTIPDNDSLAPQIRVTRLR